MIIGISAIRNSSGGAIAHLKGVLEYSPLTENPLIDRVILWTNSKVAASLDTRRDIEVIDVTMYGNSLFQTVFFELFTLRKVAKRHGVDVMLYTDASAIVSVRPSLVMSRDMLSFEPGIMSLYSGKEYLRLFVIRFLQRYNLKRADKSIFLTEYSNSVILPKSKGLIIPHGVEENWFQFWRTTYSQNIRVLYVGNAAPYKGHMELIEATKILINNGYKIQLTCIGGASGSETPKLEKYIHDQELKEVIYLKPLKPRNDIKEDYLNNDLFIFSSKCENMPNTLVEAVLSGIPVVSSYSGPMKELLGDYDYCFNAYSPADLVRVVENYLGDSHEVRKGNQEYLFNRFKEFTWKNSSAKLASALIGS